MYKLDLLKISMLSILCLVLAACSTNPKQSVSSIGFKAGTAKFKLLSTELQLSHGHGAPDDKTIFSSQDEMQRVLDGYIREKMNEYQMMDPQSNFAIEILSNYQRSYNYGGKALNKPIISYTIKIYKDGVMVRAFESGTFTTKFAGFKDAAVNLEITAFKWGKEDEPKDLEVLASVIIGDLKKIGD